MALELLNILHPDDCCNPRLSKALEKKRVLGDVWLCPKCGVEWRAVLKVSDDEEQTPYRKWEPHCTISVFRV